MIAILGGLGAAMCWATGTLTSSRAGRLIGPTSTVAWMMLVGVLEAGPLALASGPLPEMTPQLTFYLLASGLGGVAGLTLAYRALRYGKVGVVAAITSTEGAIAAAMSVATGEQLTAVVAALLCLIAAGVAYVAMAAGDTTGGAADSGLRHDPRQAVALAVAAAFCFGVSIFFTAQAGKSVPPFTAVLAIRVTGFVLVFIPMLVTRRLRLTRSAVPMVVVIGTAEVLGNASYVIGGQQSIAVAAVLASQFAAIAALAAFLLFNERLSSRQRGGIIGIVAGVALLALARA
jgi:drug/metabolite transporter (DMT)-like permease